MIVLLSILLAGILAFSRIEYRWLTHTVAPATDTDLRNLIVPGAAFAALLAMAIAALRRRRTTRTARLTRALAPMAAGLAVLVWEQLLSVQGPWPLYTWMALLALCAWRVTPLIRTRDISTRALRVIVGVATAAFVALHLTLQFDLWHALSFGYHDIGLFARALHNAAAGRGLWVDSLDRSILGEHASFALWAFVPFRMAGFPAFDLLAFASALCLNGPALLAAWLTRRMLGSNLAAALAGGAWLLLPTHGCLVIAQGYGFHEIYLAVPLISAGMALTLLRRFGPAAACMALTLTIREDLALTVAAWGLYVSIVERRRLLGLLVLAAAAAWFCLAVWVIVPHYRGEPYPHMAFHFAGNGPHAGFAASLTTTASFILTLLLPLAALPLRSPALALVAVPPIAETLLTANPELHNLTYHYYTPAVPILFFAGLDAWRKHAHRQAPAAHPPRRPRLRPGWCLLASAAFGHAYLGLGPLANTPAYAASPVGLQNEITNVRLVRALAPRDTSVTASYRIAAHFLDHDRLWTVRNSALGDLIVVDDRDDWDGSAPRLALLRAHLAGGYQPAFADYHFVVLTRQPEPTPLATELMPAKVPEAWTPIVRRLHDAIECVAMKVETSDASPTAVVLPLRVSFVWRCTAAMTGDFRFELTLPERNVRWGPFYFARGAIPTAVWTPGLLYRDDVTIDVPHRHFARIDEIRPKLARPEGHPATSTLGEDRSGEVLSE